MNTNQHDFELIVKTSTTLTEILNKLNLDHNGYNYNKIKKLANHYNVSLKHLKAKVNKIDLINNKDLKELVECSSSIKEMCNKLNINYTFYNQQIKQKLILLGYKLNYNLRKNRWSKEELNILKKYYQIKKPIDLLKLIPNKSINGIKLKAAQLNLKSPNSSYFNSKIEKLLLETNISYYWLGFVMGDGHISKNNRLQIMVSIKDKNHIHKFKKYINYVYDMKINNLNNTIGFSIQNKEIINRLKIKFDIKSNKTYNPPDLKIFENMNDNLFVSFLIGFIDADGSIAKNKNTVILHIHKNWHDTLLYFKKRIESIFKYKISNITIYDDYATMSFGGGVSMPILNHIKENKLPILTRKWNKIDKTKKTLNKFSL